MSTPKFARKPTDKSPRKERTPQLHVFRVDHPNGFTLVQAPNDKKAIDAFVGGKYKAAKIGAVQAIQLTRDGAEFIEWVDTSAPETSSSEAPESKAA